VRWNFSSSARKMEKYLNVVLPVLLLIVFAFKFLAGSESGGTSMTTEDIRMLSGWVVLLNILSMIVGFVSGWFVKLDFKNRITIAVEVGLHNTALALLIAGDKLNNHLMEKPALVYALFSFVITFLVAWTITKLNNLRLGKATKR
jgi:BASS family bile acid:Na+ symporter